MTGAATPVASGRLALRDRLGALPVWLQVVAVYLAARLVTWLVTVRVARSQVENGWTGAQPAYLDFVGIWDGDWYRKIAEGGYPVPVPVDGTGEPRQSEWAFYPAFPLLVRVLGAYSFTDWRVAAPTTALLLGTVAAVVVHRLLADRAGHGPALTAVALLAVFPSAPVLQYAYTESLALLALASALLLLARRHYLLALAPVVVLGLTRPVALPFALVVAVHLLLRWRHRGRDRLAPREAASLLVLGLGTVAAGAAWPLAVGLLNGDAGLYTRIQSAWRGEGAVVPVRPWWDMSQYLLGDVLGPIALLGLVASLVALLASRRARVMGPDLTTWCAAYLLYLLVVVEPFTSVFRFALLLFPLLLVVAVALRSRVALVAWVAASLSLQVLWVDRLWRFVPPTDYPP